MQPYLDKFDKLIKGAKSIDILFLDDNPLSIRQERNNQGGKACYCLDGEKIGRQKVKNLWKQIECNENCSYRKRDNNGKSACNRIAWLKFFIPKVATDRIWLMRITGQEAIDNLDAYIKLQKERGNSIKNTTFTIFLKQSEQTNYLGKTFNNYVLDILKKDEFISNHIQENKPQTQKQVVSSNNSNVPNTKATSQSNIQNNNIPSNTEVKEKEKATKTETKAEIKESKTNTKKTTKITSKETKKEDAKETSKVSDLKKQYPNNYNLIETRKTTLMKDGKPTEYLIAQFVDCDDKTIDAIIPPNLASELEECDIGTEVILDLKTAGDKTFTNNIEYVNKCLKNVAA